MPRVTKSVTAKVRHKKVLSSTKGHYGQEADYIKQQNNLILNLYNMLLEIENKKRSFRSLWISRINAGCRELGVSYSKLISSLSQKHQT